MPGTAMLTAMGAGYEPIATGVPHARRTPFQGIPGLDTGMGALAGMALTPQMYRMFGQVGMVPMGVGHDQNVYDTLMNQRFTQMQIRAMQMAAESDRQSIMQTMRGLAAITGTPFGAEPRRAAQALSNLAVMSAPLFAEIFPDVFDQLGGTRGSAAVMARRMIDAGRYRIDPVTGRMGMSAETVGFQAKQLFGDLYSQENLGRMQGISAGQLGSLYQELQSRGMIPTAAAETRFAGVRGDDPRAATLRALEDMARTAPASFSQTAKATGVDLSQGLGRLTAADLDKLNLDPHVADRLRSFDADRIKRSLQSYVGAISAMRDIFGDLGHPNAPMQQLVQGLEALTAGATSQLDPNRLGMMARQTYNLAKQTGVPLNSALLLQQHAGASAQMMGVEPIFAVQATQGALGFGGAYRAQGHAAYVAWGAMSSDQVQQLDANLRVQAAGSNMANRMAVATRLAEQVGGFGDSDAGRYVQAVRAGMNQWQDAAGRTRSVLVNDREFAVMMTGAVDRTGRAAGVTEGDVFALLGQRDTNREYVERYGMSAVVRRAQGADELHPFIGHRLRETLTFRLRDQLKAGGMGAGDAMSAARTAADAVAARATQRIFDMSTEEFADTESRNRGIAGILDEELTAAGHGRLLAGMDPGRRSEFLRQTADRFYGSANRAIRTSMYSSFVNMQNVHRLTNRTTLDEADRQQMQARFVGEMQEAMAPLGRGTILSRAVDALQDARPDEPGGMMRVIASALGGVRTDDINRAIIPQLRRVHERRQALESMQNDAARETDPVRRSALLEQLEVARRELATQAKELATVGEQFGMFAEGGLGAEDIGRAYRSTGSLITAQNDLAGLRGGFGAEVLPAEIAAVRAASSGRPASRLEAQAVVAAVRQRDADAIAAFVGGRSPNITQAQQQQLTAAMEAVKRMSPGATDEQARVAAVGLIGTSVLQLPPAAVAAAMRALPLEGDDGATRAVIRTRRRIVPLSANREEVDRVLAEHRGTLTEEEARELANARLRARRLGVSEDEVKHIMATQKWVGPSGEVDAIAEAFTSRAQMRMTVTPEDLKTFSTDYPNLKPTTEQLARFRERNPDLAGAADEAVIEEMNRRVILTQRQDVSRANFAEFWAGEEGAAFREVQDRAQQDVANVSQRLIESPQMVRRLGVRAIEYSERLRLTQRRLSELALYHTSGDMARLLAGDLDINISTPAGQQAYVRARTAVIAAQREQRSIIGALQEQEGLRGRQFELGDEGEALKSELDARVAAGTMDRPTADRLLSSNVSAAQRRLIRRRAAELGSEEAALDFLQIDPGLVHNLTEWQRAQMAGVRHGAGRSEEEVIGLVGAANWAKLAPADQAALAARLRKGVGDVGVAQDILRDEQGVLLSKKPQLTDEENTRVAAASAGLLSEAHARWLAGVGQGGALTPEDQDRMTMVRAGMASDEWARRRMGLPEDPIPADVRDAVRIRRERTGDAAEAARLLGFHNLRAMTPNERDTTRALMAGTGGDRARALALLGLTNATNEYDRSRLSAAMLGVGSQVHAAVASGAIPEKDFVGPLTPAQQAQVARYQARPAEEAALRLLGVDPSGVMTDEKKARLDALTQDIGLLRRLSPEQEALLVGRESRAARLDAMAKRTGISTADLTRALLGGEAVPGTAVMSEDDRRAHIAAGRRYASANASMAGATQSIAALEARLKAVDVTTPAGGVQAQQLEKQLTAVRARRDAAEADKKAALAAVTDAATARGVSTEDYLLRNRGFLTPEFIQQFRTLAGDQAVDDKKLADIAAQLGVPPERLRGAMGVIRRIDEAQRQAAAAANRPAVGIITDILKEYGFTPADQPTALHKQLASLAEGAGGRLRAEGILSSARVLKDVAGRRKDGAGGLAGVDALAAEYFAIIKSDASPEERKKKIEAFQKLYGFEFDTHGMMTGESTGRWSRFEEALQLQQQTGFLRFGQGRSDHRIYNAEGDMHRLLSQSLRGGQVSGAGPTQPGGMPANAGPVRLEGRLDVFFRGDGWQGDMAATAGGTRNTTPGQ